MRTREKRWVVRAGDGTKLAQVLAKIGDDRTAVEEGRVFIGRRRATRTDEAVRTGDVVRVTASDRSRPAPSIAILLDREGLVASIKPAGIPTVPDHAGTSHSFVALVAKQLGLAPDALRVTSRLDRDVSGAIVFARDERAEARLRTARAEGRYHRRYVAIAEGSLPEGGVWDASIGRAPSPRLRAIGGPEEKPAKTRWFRAAAIEGPSPFALLGVDPITGRTHQIRLHASHAGAPLVGDIAYGGRSRITRPNGAIVATDRIALHAARVIVPGLHGPIEVAAPVPEALVELWSALGGAPEDWTKALAVANCTPTESVE